eukprot:TRINITY_DN1080_c0_g1_i5.p2 TRINITY_DN1080_c0_g1~~TRINITY_DN1080_c0_g1_i5.p2  ORF type:complete len:107 (-),score=12.39 TRINITY_DN1080_c0_g1_i5:217-537(-)
MTKAMVGTMDDAVRLGRTECNHPHVIVPAKTVLGTQRPKCYVCMQAEQVLSNEKVGVRRTYFLQHSHNENDIISAIKRHKKQYIKPAGNREGEVEVDENMDVAADA